MPTYTVSVEGGVTAGGTPVPEFSGRTVYVFEEPAERGGATLGGEPLPVFLPVEPFAPAVEGGMNVGGFTYPIFFTTPSVIVVVYGGARVGGRTSPSFSRPGSALVNSVFIAPKPTNGVAVGGGTVLQTQTIPRYVHTPGGRIKVLGPYFPNIRFIQPTSVAGYSFLAKGGVLVGNDTFPSFAKPTGHEAAIDQGLIAVLKVSGGGGVAFIVPQVFEHITSGEIAITADPKIGLDDQNHDCWALSGMNYEPSIFTRFNFNSFAVYRGKAYGANENGLYLLEGIDDDGEPIRPGVRLITNFGSDSHKRIRSIRVGGAGTKTKARIASGNRERISVIKRDGHRIPGTRDVQGEEFIIDIVDFENLSQFEITPLVLFRK